MLLSGWSGCRAVSAAVRPLCAVGLSGSCQAVTLGPDSDGAPLMSDSAVRLSDTCCQTVRESAVNAVRLSGPLSGADLSGLLCCQAVRPGLSDALDGPRQRASAGWTCAPSARPRPAAFSNLSTRPAAAARLLPWPPFLLSRRRSAIGRPARRGALLLRPAMSGTRTPRTSSTSTASGLTSP